MILETKKQKGKKLLVLLDGEAYMACYPRDLAIAGLKEGMELTQEQLLLFETKQLLPRAKRRSLNLLTVQQYTKAALIKKLKNDGYSDLVVERTIQYLEGYHYLEDDLFANDYAYHHLRTISEPELKQKMLLKGFTQETIQQSIATARLRYEEEGALSGEPERPELMAIQSFLRKKGVTGVVTDPAKKQKLIMALYRKGFRLSDIKQVLGDFEDGIDFEG